MKATLASKVHIGEEVLFREIDGEAVILHQETGKYYGLDEVATRMWTLLLRYGQVEPVYRELLQEYEVDAERLRQDLLRFVDELASRHLIQIES